MITNIRRTIVCVIAFTAFFGFVYAFAGTGVAQAFFRGQADGSLTTNGSGSILIGQDWSQTRCAGHLRGSCVFQGRPDDLGPYSDLGNYPGCPSPKPSTGCSPVGHPGDNPLEANAAPNGPATVAGASGATNLGPRSQELLSYTRYLVAYWKARGVNPTPDLVTTSGSGLDPDITPQDAFAEIPMVAHATGISPARLRSLINETTQNRQLGFLGSPFVNVLQLNEALAKFTR
jgi:K+-transporting ATPase ATPase C chain